LLKIDMNKVRCGIVCVWLGFVFSLQAHVSGVKRGHRCRGWGHQEVSEYLLLPKQTEIKTFVNICIKHLNKYTYKIIYL